MALSDVSQRCKAMSDLGATAGIGRPYGLDGSVAFDPTLEIGRLLGNLRPVLSSPDRGYGHPLRDNT